MTGNFVRCVATAPHGGRCWLGPHVTGKHLVLTPGKVPSLAQVLRIIEARPDVDREALFLQISFEPMGKTPEGKKIKAAPGPKDKISEVMDELRALFGAGK